MACLLHSETPYVASSHIGGWRRLTTFAADAVGGGGRAASAAAGLKTSAGTPKYYVLLWHYGSIRMNKQWLAILQLPS